MPPEPEAGANPGAPAARILVVDDESALMQALCDTLTDNGYATVGVTAGQVALERLQDVVRSARRMQQLIEDLLRFSRLGRQPIALTTVRVANLVQEVLSELRKDSGLGQIDVRVGALSDCVGDPMLLKQVFVNLLSNAFKFTRGRDRPTVEVGCRAQGHDTVYFVRDNGAGFDMQYADKLFGVFQRMHRIEEFEGTGVGLSIAHRVIQRHGGRIWADAAVDKGATFYFSLTK